MIETLKIFVPQGLELLTLLSGIAVAVFVLFLLYAFSSGRIHMFRRLTYWIQHHYLLFGLLVSVVATGGSLFYSGVLGYTPCTLCWWQRIFMYPQVLLFALALWRRDSQFYRYALWLSVLGALFAGYHYGLQIGFLTTDTPCSAVGYSASCSESFFVRYGYITIPMMALTAFVMLIIFALCTRQRGDAIRYSK